MIDLATEGGVIELCKCVCFTGASPCYHLTGSLPVAFS